ncbi:hypothetical protein IE077_003574, partial [Cardiosporidium cionae]
STPSLQPSYERQGLFLVNEVSTGHTSSISACEFADVGSIFSSSVDMHSMDSEMALLEGLKEFIREVDPTVIVGFDTEKDSLGYIAQRANVLKYPHFLPLLSRVYTPPRLLPSTASSVSSNSSYRSTRQKFGDIYAETSNCEGRFIFSVWRLLKKDNNFLNYSFGWVVKQILGFTIPSFPLYALAKWWEFQKGGIISKIIHPLRWKALRYILQ